MDRLIRLSLAQIQKANDQALKRLRADRAEYEARCTAITDAINGRSRDALKQAYIDRWAIGIRKGNPTSSDATYHTDTYVKARQADFILDDRTELIDSGLLKTLCGKLGTLFTMDSQTWEYHTGTGEEDTDTAEVIQANRDEGGFLDAMTRADVTSVGAGQCAVLLSWRDGVVYRVVEPAHFCAVFGPTVQEGSAESEPYATDYTDIEDASVIIMRESTAATSADRSCYAAWIGRCEEWPAGRYVRYYAGTEWLAVPDPGSPDIFYESATGNPLTVAQNAAGIEAVPNEYPFVILFGQRVEDINTVPADDLYWANVDTSLGLSRVLTGGIIEARGCKALQNPNYKPLPETVEGVVLLGEGQLLTDVSAGSDSAKGGLDVVLATCRLILQQHGVPAEEISVEGAPTTESGVAVLLKNAPLETARKFRAKINETGVKRLFDIERSLINYHGTDTIPIDTTQRWDCGSFVPPLDLEALARRQAMEITNGTLDVIGAIAERYGITRDEAREKKAAMDEDKPTPPPAPAPTGFIIPPRGPRGRRMAPNEEQAEEATEAEEA